MFLLKSPLVRGLGSRTVGTGVHDAWPSFGAIASEDWAAFYRDMCQAHIAASRRRGHGRFPGPML